ncbi:MAG: oligosaccharide flippase family protein [Pyrinomonadaceae bacterium]|nr:oligosaccharide flippase family protein [Pyrinomonadaceae bacterium]
MENSQPQTSKSIARNVIYGFLTWILPLGLSFAATPVIFKALGKKDYGIYVLVLSFIGYSFTFGIGRTITKYVAEYRSSGETEKIRDVISTTFFINVAIGFVGVALICLSANFIVEGVFKIGEEDQSKTVTGLYIAGAIIFFTMLNQVFNAVLQGIHRFDVYSKILNASNFAQLLGNLALAWLGYGLLVLLGWNLLIICLTGAVFAVGAKKLLPEFGISFRFKRETIGLVLKYSSGIIGYQILSNFLLLFERGWITRQSGAENLTYYVVPMTLGIYILGFISSLMLVIFPLVSELKDNRKKLLKLYAKATKIVCLLVVFMTMTLIVESDLFLELWMGENFAEKSSTFLIIHSITFGLTAILSVSWQMTEGLGFPNYNFKVFAVCLIVSVLLMIGLTQNYGNTGVAIARLSGFAVIFFSIFYVEKWFFGKIQWAFWSRLSGTLAVAASAGAIVEFVIRNNLPVRWTSFIFSVGCGGVVYCLMLWLLNFVTADEKILLKDILSRKKINAEKV